MKTALLSQFVSSFLSGPHATDFPYVEKIPKGIVTKYTKVL